MANQDSFIDEVTEEVRRDRLFALFRRYGWIAGLLVVLIVAGAAWNEWRRAAAEAEAQALGDTILSALASDSPSARAGALDGLQRAEGAGPVAAMLYAAAVADDGDMDAALAEFDRLASDANVPQYYRDLAALKAVMLGAEVLSPEDRIARLAPLTAPGGAYRPLALEQTAIAHVDAGDREAALGILRGLVGDAEATDSLRGRAAQMIIALGGALDAS